MPTLKNGVPVPADEMKLKFLEEYEKTLRVSAACDALGLVRRTVYHWLANDPDFVKKFEESRKMILGQLEDEAQRRAVEGVEEPVYQGGIKVGTVKKFSDTLLIVLLKANAPHKYKEKFAGDPDGANGSGGQLKIVHVNSDVPLLHEETLVIRERRPDSEPLSSYTSADIDVDEMLS